MPSSLAWKTLAVSLQGCRSSWCQAEEAKAPEKSCAGRKLEVGALLHERFANAFLDALGLCAPLGPVHTLSPILSHGGLLLQR